MIPFEVFSQLSLLCPVFFLIQFIAKTRIFAIPVNDGIGNSARYRGYRGEACWQQEPAVYSNGGVNS
jgi:hypothetical protein